MDTTISREEFVVMLRRAGVTIPDDQIDELYASYGTIANALDRLRAAGEAEPAHVFIP